MTKSTRIPILVLLFLMIGSVAIAQDLSLNGRSAIEINLGFWGGASASTTVGTGAIRTEAGTSGFTGSLGYAYWLREHLALTLTGGLRSAEASSTVNLSGSIQRSSAVIPVLLGVRFYVPEPAPSENIRPFLSVGVGPYFGAEAASTALSQQSHVETAIGGRLGAGIDFLVGNHFNLGADLGYHFMADFKNDVGGRKNYNGGEFCFVAGYIF